MVEFRKRESSMRIERGGGSSYRRFELSGVKFVRKLPQGNLKKTQDNGRFELLRV